MLELILLTTKGSQISPVSNTEWEHVETYVQGLQAPNSWRAK